MEKEINREETISFILGILFGIPIIILLII